MNWKIPLFKSYWDEEDIESVAKVIRRGTYWANGPEIKELETKIAKYIGTKYALSFNSGTSALHANLLALNTTLGYLPKCNFKAVKANYIVFFPRFLKKLRFLERLLFWFPLGAQYALVIMKTSLADKCKKSK